VRPGTLTPKTLARILRFDHARSLLESGAPASDVALDCGYYDQAHLIREFHALAGTTPGRLAERLAAERIDIQSVVRG